jgi:hypothetical protein
VRTDVVRVGDTMRRPAGRWTPAVQALLHHVRARGFDLAPEPLGVDDEGREVVAYLDGASGADGWDHIASDSGVGQIGRQLRAYHDVSASFVPPPDARWKLPPLPGLDGRDPVVCHGDFTPWNLVWRNGTIVGVIDWELARPGDRLDDLAWTAVWTVPLRSDAEAVDGWGCWTEPPDRVHRLDGLLDAYGLDGVAPAAVVAHAAAVLRRTHADVVALAEEGFEPQRTWVQTGEADADLARAEWIERAVRHQPDTWPWSL